jgi:hypothetical protein
VKRRGASTIRSPQREILEDLHYQYVVRTPAAEAVRRYDALAAGGDLGALEKLLRHHSDYRGGTVPDRKTRRRDEYDYLLSFYSLLSVAVLLGATTIEHIKVVVPQARLHLNDPAIRRYCELHYPTLGPQLLRLQLAGRVRAADTLEYHHGLEQLRRICESGDGIDRDEWTFDRFLWLVDDGIVDWDSEDGTDLQDLVKLLHNPDKLLRATAAHPDDRSDLANAAIGFGKFMKFAINFDQLLREFEELRIVQSAVWHHHGYWFTQLKKYPANLLTERTLLQGRDAPSSDSVGLMAADAIERLCSGRCEWPVRQIVFRGNNAIDSHVSV